MSNTETQQVALKRRINGRFHTNVQDNPELDEYLSQGWEIIPELTTQRVTYDSYNSEYVIIQVINFRREMP